MQIFYDLSPTTEYSAVALGFFDGIHLGHQAVALEAVNCKKDGLIPSLFTFIKSPRDVLTKGNCDYIETADHKIQQLENIGIEKLYIIDFKDIMALTPQEFVEKILFEKLNAKKVFCGFNYHFGKGGKATGDDLAEICKNFGIEAVVVPPVVIDGDVVSSTRIRKLLLEGDIKEANKLLGYNFGITSKVVHGNHIGKGLGFPTINQVAVEGLILPKFGVYASIVTVDGKRYCGVTNVGVKPTVGDYAPLYETWMPEYDGDDIYDKTIKVELVEFIRPEKKFASFEELKENVLQNAKQALEIVKLGLSQRR